MPCRRRSGAAARVLHRFRRHVGGGPGGGRLTREDREVLLRPPWNFVDRDGRTGGPFGSHIAAVISVTRSNAPAIWRRAQRGPDGAQLDPVQPGYPAAGLCARPTRCVPGSRDIFPWLHRHTSFAAPWRRSPRRPSRRWSYINPVPGHGGKAPRMATAFVGFRLTRPMAMVIGPSVPRGPRAPAAIRPAWFPATAAATRRRRRRGRPPSRQRTQPQPPAIPGPSSLGRPASSTARQASSGHAPPSASRAARAAQVLKQPRRGVAQQVACRFGLGGHRMPLRYRVENAGAWPRRIRPPGALSPVRSFGNSSAPHRARRWDRTRPLRRRIALLQINTKYGHRCIWASVYAGAMAASPGPRCRIDRRYHGRRVRPAAGVCARHPRRDSGCEIHAKR